MIELASILWKQITRPARKHTNDINLLVNYQISKEDLASSAEPAHRVCVGSRQSQYRDFTEVELQLIPYRSHILIYPEALLSTVPAVDKSIIAK